MRTLHTLYKTTPDLSEDTACIPSYMEMYHKDVNEDTAYHDTYLSPKGEGL